VFDLALQPPGADVSAGRNWMTNAALDCQSSIPETTIVGSGLAVITRA
jgi:hypothetical protein